MHITMNVKPLFKHTSGAFYFYKCSLKVNDLNDKIKSYTFVGVF